MLKIQLFKMVRDWRGTCFVCINDLCNDGNPHMGHIRDNVAVLWRDLSMLEELTEILLWHTYETHTQSARNNYTRNYRVWTGSKSLKPSITALWQFCSLLCDISNDCVYKLYMSNVPPPSRPHTAKQIENTKHWPFCSSLTILEEDVEQDDSDFVHDGNVGV